MADVAGAGLGLLLAAPVLLCGAALLKLTGQPLLYRQTRPGLGGKPFVLLKLRTMTDGVGPDGALLPDAERLTPVGRVLRKLSIDELPQLWNVLRGEMSLVGPRPLLMEYLPLYTPEQMQRHRVRPGITGWAQVSGRNDLSWEEKLALDAWYVDNWSLRLDLKILAMTALKVLCREGISQEGHATAPKFTGTHGGHTAGALRKVARSRRGQGSRDG